MHASVLLSSMSHNDTVFVVFSGAVPASGGTVKENVETGTTNPDDTDVFATIELAAQFPTAVYLGTCAARTTVGALEDAGFTLITVTVTRVKPPHTAVVANPALVAMAGSVTMMLYVPLAVNVTSALAVPADEVETFRTTPVGLQGQLGSFCWHAAVRF